jgi:hypothetical protein
MLSAMQRNTASGRRLMDHEAIELVRSIRNRCDLLLSEAVRHELPYAVYTLCEDLLIDAQKLVDQVCVIRDG